MDQDVNPVHARTRRAGFAGWMKKYLSATNEPVSDSRLAFYMKINILTGCGGVIWYSILFPNQFLNVFFKNELGASSLQLGILVAAIQISTLFNLVSYFLYRTMRSRKPLWFACNMIQRPLGILFAIFSVYVAQGGDRQLIIKLMIGSAAMAHGISALSATGWWTWQADLFPERIRATFFGRRAAITGTATTIWFFMAVMLLDMLKFVNIFYVYAAIFFIGGCIGIADIIIHALIAEPVRARNESASVMADFFKPLRCGNFRMLAAGIGLWALSVNIFMPFLAPYITAPEHIGAPLTWLGVMFACSQAGWILSIGRWGKLMDRFGRKGILLIVACAPILWIAYLFMTHGNYYYFLPCVAFVSGITLPVFHEASMQLMLTLSPANNRIAYVSWYLTIIGLISSMGSVMGGKINDILATFQYRIYDIMIINGFHCVLLLSIVLSMISIVLISRIKEENSKSPRFIIGRMALSLSRFIRIADAPDQV